MKVVGIVVLVFLVVAFLFIFSKQPPVPEEFVSIRTVENYSTFFHNYEILRYPSSVEIMPIENLNETIVIGFVTDPWNINFGIIPGNGSYVTRTIEVSNKGGDNNEVFLNAYGNISPLVVFSKNNFILKPDEKASIEIFLYSKDSEPGNYSGEIDVVSKKAIYNFLSII
ncbi:MAG: hypothetical protein ABIE55_02060 [Candidatus Aenigmatarchaeota archaeon]